MLEIVLSLVLEKGAARRQRLHRFRRLPRARAVGALLFASLLACLWARPSLAQDDGSPEALIRQGVALRRMGEESKAYGYFRRAYETAPTPRSGAQFGLSSVAVGKFAEGEWLLSEAMASGDPWTSEHRLELDKGRTTARSKLGAVVLVGVAPDATIAIGGRTLGRVSADATVRWMPGTTHVHLEAPGYEPFEGDVKFPAPLRETRWTVSMPFSPRPQSAPTAPAPVSAIATPAETPSPPVSRVDSPSAVPGPQPFEKGTDTGASTGWRRPVMWGALGVGAASVAFGVFETLHYRSTVDDFNKPSRMPLCREGGGAIVGGAECERLASEGDRAKTLSIVGYAVGGALLTASLVLVLTDPSPATGATTAGSDGDQGGPDSRKGRSSERMTMACGPWLGLVGGASCSVRF